MYNQKIIKKIKRCAKEGSYDELLNYIKEAIDLVDGYSVLLCGLCGGSLRLSPCPVFPRLDTVILPLLFKVSRPVLP